jgi:hypothetical protein
MKRKSKIEIRNPTPLLRGVEERAGVRRKLSPRNRRVDPLLGPLPTPSSWGEEENPRGARDADEHNAKDTERRNYVFAFFVFCGYHL